MVLSSPLRDKITFYLNIYPAANNFFIHRNREIGMLKSEPYVLVEQRNSKLPHYWFRLTNLRFQSVAIYPNITHVTLIIVMR